jgi:hypothetical protein
MSLLFERGSANAQLPNLAGGEVLEDPKQPDRCMVKGVMLVGRQKFIREQFGEQETQAVLARLSPAAQKYAVTPLSGSWIPFSTLVEYDRAIHEHFKARRPNILALVGAASAEYGIGTVYRVLDNKELTKFLEAIVHFHEQYQRFGRVAFTKTPTGGVMEYFEYPCFSRVFCESAIGFFQEAILRHGGKDPKVVEPKCHCRGDSVCRFEMTWQ